MSRHKCKEAEEEKAKERFIKNRTFKGIIFSSIFEKEVAQYLTSCKIQWERNEKRFPTFIDGSVHYYVPDFYLPDMDLYVEVKGIFHTAAKKRKTFKAINDNKLNWIILYLKEWKIKKRTLKEKINQYINERSLSEDK